MPPWPAYQHFHRSPSLHVVSHEARPLAVVRELRSLQLGWTVDGAALVLEGLADGACPKLRELRLERPSACENSEGEHEAE